MAEKSSAYQGPRDFTDFDDYRENWIIPNLLPDLDTVFLGAREHAKKLDKTARGGGVFALGTALCGAFDHLGSFLAKWDKDPNRCESLKQTDNIARTAKCLPSTADVCAIFANLGRNALVHAFWPQTAMPMEGGWAFGYSLGGDVDTEHDQLYITSHSIDPKQHNPERVKVLKLAQNVYVLHKELAKAVREGPDFRNVSQKAFERVQEYSMRVGLPGKSAHDELEGLIEGKLKTLRWGMTRKEARKLKRIAEDKKIWDDPEFVYYRRTDKIRRASMA
jgi:hypothetical protein